MIEPEIIRTDQPDESYGRGRELSRRAVWALAITGCAVFWVVAILIFIAIERAA